MVVAFEKGLEGLKAQMRACGFETVTYGEYHRRIDALVYSGAVNMTAVTNAYESDGGGVLMVNSHGKTARDVAEILRHKVYSPLF